MHTHSFVGQRVCFWDCISRLPRRGIARAIAHGIRHWIHISNCCSKVMIIEAGLKIFIEIGIKS